MEREATTVGATPLSRVGSGAGRVEVMAAARLQMFSREGDERERARRLLKRLVFSQLYNGGWHSTVDTTQIK